MSKDGGTHPSHPPFEKVDGPYPVLHEMPNFQDLNLLLLAVEGTTGIRDL